MLSSPRIRRDRNRRTSKRDADAGNTHVLEAVIVVSIMLSAVVFVVTFDEPAPASDNARADLGVIASDALKILYDTPVESDYGTTALSAFVAECLNNQCKNLEERLGKLVPPGASYALYVSNGYETYPVIVQGAPRAEAASSSIAFEPQWSSTFVSTATRAVGPEDPLVVYALPLYHSNALTADGSQLLVKLIGSRSDSSDYVVTAAYSTVAHAMGDVEASGASLTFVDAAGDPLPVHDLVGSQGSPRRVHLRLAETEGGRIPVGTELSLHVPRGWTAVAPEAENPDWQILSAAEDPSGAYSTSTLRAALDRDLVSDSALLAVDITYHGDVLDYYGFVATTSKGGSAVASMLVRGSEHGETPPMATPLLHMSVPSPMGKGAPAAWTLSAYIPGFHDPDLPPRTSEAVRLREIQIVELEGNPVFAEDALSTDDAAGGSWSSTPSSLLWKHEEGVLLHSGTVLNLTFEVKASGIAGPQASRSAFYPPITFDTFTGRIVERTGWGFLRQAILPESEQYRGHNTEPTVNDPHEVHTDAIFRQTPLPGRSSYHADPLLSIEDALWGSYVSAERRTVPIGGQVVINANVQSMLFTLAEAGQRAGVTLRFYPPWSGDSRVPIHEQKNLDQGLVAGEVSQLIVLDINGDGVGDPVVGTTNGRVIAYHGLTGQRLQGNTFVVPLAETATQAVAQQKTFPKITTLMPYTVGGVEYIAVGTDRNSDGVFVLSKEFEPVWRYRFNVNADVLAMDAGDMNGDGRPELIAARTYEAGLAKNTLVYVLEAVEGTYDMVPISNGLLVTEDENAFYYALGTPSTLLAQIKAGPTGEGPGILVPVQTTYDPGITYDISQLPPRVERRAGSTPRAGVQAVDHMGKDVSTAFGAPASVLRRYDYDQDGVEDVVMGGASGYVTIANGRVLTQPLYSYILAGASSIISADTPTSAQSYVLSSDGGVYWTDDAWVSIYGPDNSLTGAKAIAARGYNDIWVVGTGSQVWRSMELPVDPDLPMYERHPAAIEMVPVVFGLNEPTRNGVHYSLAVHQHDLRDIRFHDGEAWVVGAKCPALCSEGFVMHSKDGGTSWAVLTHEDGTLLGGADGEVTANLNRIRFSSSGTGWIVGERGTILRQLPDAYGWKQVDVVSEAALFDIACKPQTPQECLAVGEKGVAFRTLDNGDTWEDVTGKQGLPGRTLHSVGYPDDHRAYVGTTNMVLASFHGGDWTTLPLNYVENDARVISTPGRGVGYVYGGSPANARIWLLHDYHVRTLAKTDDIGRDIPDCANIQTVALSDGDISFAQQKIGLNVSFDGSTWIDLGLIYPPGEDDDVRRPIIDHVATAPAGAGCELFARFSFKTASDKTILSPHIRRFEFAVVYEDADGAQQTHVVSIDPSRADHADLPGSTAAWNAHAGAIHQAFVEERWTRNVSGQVHDLETGFDVGGADDRAEVWVATGDVLAENSPDYLIYAGTNREPQEVIEGHNRIYLLDGKNGHPLKVSDPLAGEVRQISLWADAEGELQILYAIAWKAGAPARLYALHPASLDEFWSVELLDEIPAVLALGKFPGSHSVYVGTKHAPDTELKLGHLHAYEPTGKERWRILPDDLGKYLITKMAEPDWPFGAYVVEVEVEWSETVTSEGKAGQQVLRSARFYDHFVLTPPDLVSPPSPVYTARLLVWMQDWG